MHTKQFVDANDGTPLYIKDWGSRRGRPIVFVHSWAVTNQLWNYQHAYFADQGCRVIAFDRRGHGRSGQPDTGYDLDTLADDLGRVLDALEVEGATLVGHSMGCNEIVRYLTRHGTHRVARIALVGATTPCLVKSEANPIGLELATIEVARAAWRRDWPGWLHANVRAFFMPETSQAMLDFGVDMMLQMPLRIALACNRALVADDCREDLRAIGLPALVVHGTADVSAPFELTAVPTAALLRNSRLARYDGAPHGLMFTHAEQLHADLSALMAA